MTNRAILCALSLLPAVAGGEGHHFVNTDVFELEIASDPRISPDGERIAYVRRSMDIMTDRARGNIWLVSDDGDDHRPLESGTGSYSNPRWSPDGTRLAYVSAVAERGPELYVRFMETGESALLTNLPAAPSSITWSPDGTQIAFAMHTKVETKPLAEPSAKPEGAEWAPPVTVVEDIFYRADGEGYLEPGHTQLYVVPADGGTARQLTTGPYDHGGPLAWSGDGARIYFGANRVEGWEHDPLESELWSVDVASGELTVLTDRDGPDRAPAVSPDGRRIAWLGYDDRRLGYHNTRVYVMNVDGEDRRVVNADFDRSIDALAWAGSSRRLYVQYDDHGRTHIAALDLDGDLEPLVGDVSGESISRPYTSGGFSVADDGRYAYTRGSALRPADVGIGGRRGEARTLTQLNEDLLAHKALAPVETIRFESAADGREIEGWLARPPGFDPEERYPLVLEIHGGPFAAYGPHFSAEVQLYAAAGYVVLYVNPRGSTSYGAEFANEIHHNYPGQDYDDLMSGVDAVIERGFVDADRLYVTGGSGGGVLTAWIVGKTDRFRAAVSAKPVINWASMVLTSDISTFVPRYWFTAMPWEEPEAYWRRSPLSLVGNVTTPTMLLTGEQDFRTPISESEQFYQALKLARVDTALVRIPEAPHGIARRPSHLIAKVDNILAWFERYGGDESR